VVAPSLTWNVGDRTKVDLDFFYFDEDVQEDYGVVAFGNRPANFPISRYLQEPSTDKSNTKLYYVGLTLNHEFTADWKILAKFIKFNRDVLDQQTFGSNLDKTTGILDRGFYGGIDNAEVYYGGAMGSDTFGFGGVFSINRSRLTPLINLRNEWRFRDTASTRCVGF
jgi:iron complex outermembrane recepter protein